MTKIDLSDNGTIDYNSPQEDQLLTLELEISELRKQLKDAEKLEGHLTYESKSCIPSISDGMLRLSFLPIGLHFSILILCKIFGIGEEPIFSNSWFSLKGNLILALYFSAPLTGILFGFCVESNRCYKEVQREKGSREEVIKFLEEELSKKLSQYYELNAEISASKVETLGMYRKRLEERKLMIYTLVNLRKKVISNYKRGTLDQFLKKIGFTPEVIEESKEFIEKKFTF